MSFRRAVAPALALAVIVSLASLIGTPDGASAAEIRPHDSLVPDSPKGGYPIILKEPLRDVPNPDNNPNLPGATWRQVFAADQAGRFIVTGGDFYQIELQDGTVLQQKYFAAWNIDTKQIVCPNKFVFDNEVLAVEPGPSPTQVYVGGRFTKVTGSDGVQRTRNKVALLDLADCSVDRTFASTGANGKINEVVLSNGRLFVGGDFTSIGGVNQPVIAELNPVTGRTDTNWRVSFSGGLTSKIRGMSANPDGTRLIFGGRFGTVTDTRGKSIPGSVTAILDITSNPPRLTDHSYAYTHPEAPGRAYGHSLQDVSISPDGTNIGLAFGTTTISDYVYLVPAVERGTNHTWGTCKATSAKCPHRAEPQ